MAIFRLRSFARLVSILILSSSKVNVDGALVTKPESILACTGSTDTSFRCMTNDVGLQWTFRSSNISRTKTEYPYTEYDTQKGYSVDRTNSDKSVQLKIDKVTSDSAGTYTCGDRGGAGENFAVQLVVIQKVNCNITDVGKQESNICCYLESVGNDQYQPVAHCYSSQDDKKGQCSSNQGEVYNKVGGRRYCLNVTLTEKLVNYTCTFSLKPMGDCSHPWKRNGDCYTGYQVLDVSIASPRGRGGAEHVQYGWSVLLMLVATSLICSKP